MMKIIITTTAATAAAAAAAATTTTTIIIIKIGILYALSAAQSTLQINYTKIRLVS